MADSVKYTYAALRTVYKLSQLKYMPVFLRLLGRELADTGFIENDSLIVKSYSPSSVLSFPGFFQNRCAIDFLYIKFVMVSTPSPVSFYKQNKNHSVSIR